MILYLLIAITFQSSVDLETKILNSSFHRMVSQPADTTKVLVLIKEAEKLQHNDPAQADSLSQEALKISRALAFPKGINYSLTNLVSVNLIQGKYGMAEKYNQELFELAERGDFEAKLKALNRFAVIDYYQAEYQRGIERNLEVLQLLQDQSKHDSRIYALNNIGINYERLEQMDKALEYYHQAVKLAHELGQDYPAAAITGNMGIIYKNRGAMDSASELFLQSIAAAERINNVNLLIDGTANLAEVYLMQGKYVDARAQIRKSLAHAETINDQNGILKAHYLIGRLYQQKGDVRSAITAFHKSLEQSDSLGDREMLMSTYAHLHQCYWQLGKSADAYRALNNYSAIRDSVFKTEKNIRIEELEAKYQASLKDAEIARQQLEIARQNTQRTRLIAALIFLVLLGAGTYLFLNMRIQKNLALANHERSIQQQKIHKLETEKKLLSMTAMIEGQESERIRIAKDLHDGLGGLLTSVRTQMGRIEHEIARLLDIDLTTKTNNLIDEATREVQRISQNLMPGVLRLEGLQVALEDLCERFEEVHGLKVDRYFNLVHVQLSETHQTFIYRIFQELMTNIAKHAKASSVLVQVNNYDDHLNLIAEDDGQGFDTSQEYAGVGLRSIQSRVDFLNGTMEISSTPNIGTSFSINIPK